MKTLRYGLILGLALGLVACSGDSDDLGDLGGKSEVIGASYQPVMSKVNDNWEANEEGEEPMTRIEDAYQVKMLLKGGKSLVAKTHMFNTGTVTVIPYGNPTPDSNLVKDAKGNEVHGDSEIAKAFPPGQIGYAIKHHRPEHRALNLASTEGASESDLKENFKLMDTHIELVVGVKRTDLEGSPNGAITLNNPQSYEDGAFGDKSYSMVFVKPTYPEGMDAKTIKAYNDNIRTMMVGFNAVSDFPGDYNGGDPLGARNPDKVRELTANMILAIAGEGSAQDKAIFWFKDAANQIYCAELAHVSSSAGMLVPLNEENVMKLQKLTVVGDDMSEADWSNVWDTFQDHIKAHNNKESTPFLEMNDNKRVKLVEITAWPADVEPTIAEDEDRIAFMPMTMADIIRSFLRTHVPRDPSTEGTWQAALSIMDDEAAQAAQTAAANDSTGATLEKVVEQAMAPVQGALLMGLKNGIYNAMDLLPKDSRPGATPEQAAQIEEGNVRRAVMREGVVEPLFQAILAVVATPHDSYDDFLDALETTPFACDPTTLKTGNSEDERKAICAAHPFNGVGLMPAAQMMTGPRPDAEDQGSGLFVPPSLLHTIAQGAHPGGILGLEYVGHGLHFSMVEPTSGNTAQ